MRLSITASSLLTNEIGLHARPSVKLTKLAKTFASKIEVAPRPEGRGSTPRASSR